MNTNKCERCELIKQIEHADKNFHTRKFYSKQETDYMKCCILCINKEVADYGVR